MSAMASRSRPARVIGSTIVLAAAAVSALAAVAASSLLGGMLDDRWATFGRTGFVGLVAWLLPMLLIGAGIVSLRRVSEGTLARWTPAAPLVLLVLVRVGAILLAPTPLPADNDPRYLHELAVGVLDGGNPVVAPRPMGYSTLLATLYAAFGVHPFLAEILNLGAAALAGWALFTLVDRRWGRRAAALAVFVYAIVPSQVLLVTTIFTETVYAALLLSAIALAGRGVAANRTLVVAGAGLVLALSQYVRPLSQAFLAIFAATPLLTARRWTRGAILAVAISCTFLVAVTPIVVNNATVHGALSLSSSSYGGWSLFVGANQEHDGRFNPDDQAILAATPRRTVWEQSERFGQLGIERITSDPAAFAELAVRKFRVLWADDTYAVSNAFPGWEPMSIRHDALRMLSQTVYVGVVVLAALGFWQSRLDPSPVVLLLAGVLVIVAAAHIFVEVQPRYHAYIVPFLCAMAALPLAGRRQAPQTPASA